MDKILKSEAEIIMSNKLCCYVQINSVKHIATEFIMSNKLRYASPPERLSKINLLCKQKSSRINNITLLVGNDSLVYTVSVRSKTCKETSLLAC